MEQERCLAQQIMGSWNSGTYASPKKEFRFHCQIESFSYWTEFFHNQIVAFSLQAIAFRILAKAFHNLAKALHNIISRAFDNRAFRIEIEASDIKIMASHIVIEVFNMCLNE